MMPIRHWGWLLRAVGATGRVAAALIVAAACSGGDNSPVGPVLSPDGGPTGASPEVQPCARGTACADGLFCDPLGGCVACVFDEHCGDGEWCSERACVPAESCERSSDCSTVAAPTCDAIRGRCVGCVVDDDCGSSAHCEAGACVAFTPCINTFDCTGGLVCDRGKRECVQCVTAGDCDENEACFANECTPMCASDNDCVSLNQLCDTANGHCAQCVEHVDCPQVYHCVAGSCTLDVCAPGESRCLQGSGSLATCNEIGDAFEPSDCGPQSSCVETSGRGVCQPWLCNPREATCRSDASGVQICASDGLSYESNVDCPTGEHCLNGSCRELACPPGLSYCDGDGIGVCNATGTAQIDFTLCPTGQFCNPTTVACEDAVCSASTPMCDGRIATVCEDDGSGPAPGGVDCEQTGELCVDGACVPLACIPNERFCGFDGHLYDCNSAGTAFSFVETCGGGFDFRNCVQEGTTATCEPIICTPGELFCDGNTIATCDFTGTKADPGGTDCGSNEACFNAQCLGVVCQGTSYCVGNTLTSCEDNGTRVGSSVACSSATYCAESGDTASCAAQLCTPNQPACDGDRATTCNADGSGYQSGGSDCSQTSSACVSGSCLPIICTPSQRFCQNGNVFSCGSDGTTSSLYQTCSVSYYCNETSTTATCSFDVCTAGTPTCRGDVATTCKSDGSGPEDTGGTDCSASGQACEAGSCMPIICTADQRFCDSGHAELCNASGTAHSRVDTCATNEFCDPNGYVSGGAACVPDVCEASAPSCDGERPATCLADGSGWSAGGSACSSGQVCNESSACSATASDVVGSIASSSTSSNRLIGNYYEVHTSRRLTEIEAYISVTGTSLFTWLVYEADSTAGPWTKIGEKATTSSGSDQFHSSGAIDVQLTAGKVYFIGVQIDGSMTYFRQGSGSPTFVSFGRELAGEFVSASSPPSTLSYGADFYAYHQRLTTAAP